MTYKLDILNVLSEDLYKVARLRVGLTHDDCDEVIEGFIEAVNYRLKLGEPVLDAMDYHYD